MPSRIARDPEIQLKAPGGSIVMEQTEMHSRDEIGRNAQMVMEQERTKWMALCDEKDVKIDKLQFQVTEMVLSRSQLAHRLDVIENSLKDKEQYELDIIDHLRMLENQLMNARLSEETLQVKIEDAQLLLSEKSMQLQSMDQEMKDMDLAIEKRKLEFCSLTKAVSDNAAHENDIIELLEQIIQKMAHTMTEISLQSQNVLKEKLMQLQSSEDQNKALNVQLSNVSLSVQDLHQKLSDSSFSKQTLDQKLHETVLVLDEKLMQLQSLEGQNKSLSMQLSISSQSEEALRQELQEMEREHKEKSMHMQQELQDMEREHKEKSMQVQQELQEMERESKEKSMQVQSMDVEIKMLNEKLSYQEKLTTTLTQTVRHQHGLIESLERKVVSFNAECDTLKAQAKRDRAEIDALDVLQVQLKNEKDLAIKGLQDEKDRAIKGLQDEVEKRSTQLEEFYQQKSEVQDTEMERLRSEIVSMRPKLDALERESRERESHRRAKTVEIDKMREKLETFKGCLLMLIHGNIIVSDGADLEAASMTAEVKHERESECADFAKSNGRTDEFRMENAAGNLDTERKEVSFRRYLLLLLAC